MLFDQEYVVDEAISQSDMKLFENDIQAFKHYKIDGTPREGITSKAMDVGNIIDALLLAPHELENYYVLKGIVIEPAIKDIVDLAYAKGWLPKSLNEKDPRPLPKWMAHDFLDEKSFKVIDENGTDDQNLANLIAGIMSAIVTLNYQANWKKVTRLNKVLEKGEKYYEALVESKGRSIIHVNEYNRAVQRIDAVKEDKYTADMFNNIFTERQGVSIHKQETLYGEFEGQKIKGKLDMFEKDDNKKVIQPWDVKSSRSHRLFLSNYRSQKYGRQGTFYTELLRQNFPGYTILPFKFLTIPTETEERPEVYLMDTNELYINEYGYTYESGYRIPGWRDVLRDIAWHKEKNLWDHRKEYYATGMNVISSRLIIANDMASLEDKPALF